MRGRRLADYTGQKFGKLTALYRTKIVKHRAIWLFVCECGNLVETVGAQVAVGRRKSCGCSRSESRPRCTTPDGLKHKTKSRAYNKWQQMMQLCYNQKRPHYRYYGGRGITVCEEWKNSPVAFIEWAELRGVNQAGSVLRRFDPTQEFSPENCYIYTRPTDAEDK